MFCDKCGNELKDGVKFCRFCGNQINNISQSPQYNTAPPQYRQQQYGYQYNNPYSYQQPACKANSGTATSLIAAAIICIIVAFVGIFTDWLEVKASYLDTSKKESYDFSDIMDSDYDDFTSYDSALKQANSRLGSMKNLDIKESDYDLAKWGFRLMKWCGLAGYVMLIISLIFVFIKRKLLCVFSIISSLMFILSLAGTLIYCNRAKKMVDAIMKFMIGTNNGISIECYPAIGLWLSLIGALGACICSFVINSKSKSSY